MTAHRRDNESFATFRLHRVNDAAEQFDEATHAAAAGSNRDSRSRRDAVQYARLNKFAANIALNVVDMIGRQLLSNSGERGKLAAGERHRLAHAYRPCFEATRHRAMAKGLTVATNFADSSFFSTFAGKCSSRTTVTR